MKNVINNLVAIIGITLLGLGIANATPSSDCGDDDDVRPINVHSAAKAISKDT